METLQDTLHDTFKAYLDLGYSVIPLQPGGKRPLLESWKPYQERLARPGEVAEWLQKWPDCNIGIVTGAISGIVVIDVDFEHGGDESLLDHLLKMGLGALRASKAVKTPHGKHFYFRHPCDGTRIPNKQGLLPGIDVRGDGGYVVAPGSVVDGIEYRELSTLNVA